MGGIKEESHVVIVLIPRVKKNSFGPSLPEVLRHSSSLSQFGPNLANENIPNLSFGLKTNRLMFKKNDVRTLYIVFPRISAKL